MPECSSSNAADANAGDTHSIDVWRIDVEYAPADMSALLACLDESERRRAARFHSDADRRRFVAAHAATRCIIGHRLARSPAGLHFDEGEHGKPSLRGHAGPPWFNISHSGRWALCALCSAAPPGVDVEQPRDSPDHLAIARRWFTAAECATLQALPAARQGVAFRRLWVCKEALLKSDGHGISGGLGRFELELSDSAVTLLRVAGDDSAARQWSLLTFELADGYAGAVAAPAAGLRVDLHDFGPGDFERLREVQHQV